MSLASTVMHGMSIVGSLFMPAKNEEELGDKIQLMTNTLVGLYDEAILCAMFSNITKELPSEIAQATANIHAQASLTRLKDLIRNDIQKVMEQGAAEDRQNLVLKLKETNKPHPMGTVNEIAAKLNISKSEVRRLKANGTLDSMLAVTEQA
jgi:DNA invertase Pin-like site-specific DNA recombinase